MKLNFTLLSLFISGVVMAQDPQLDSWMLNTTGTLAQYDYYPAMPPTTNHVNMTDSADVLEVCYDNNYVYIRTNGLASYTMGPWVMNPNQPSAHSATYRIPRNPAEQTGTKTSQPTVGAQAVAINGVKIYGFGDARSYNSVSGQNDPNGDDLWHGDAWASEGATMDANGAGHPDEQGNYHYHATPVSFYSDPSTAHSPIIGFAFDGFPIYGPFGYSDSLDNGSAVIRMQSSYQLRSITDRTILPGGATSTPAGPAINTTFPLGTYWEDYEYVAGLGTLDEYNGRYCVTPEYPSGTYAYFLATDNSGDPVFPYIIGFEYYGQVNASDIGALAGNISIPSSGVTCGATSSIEETETELVIYPNPASTILNIEGGIGANYKIYDLLGRQIAMGVVNGPLNIESFETGTYILEIEKNEKSSFTQFIIE
ncbi:MAG: YHYH protein [Crocinitomicaceae bacterium]|nr:YHYH protein [Crocinitomicaceae bacterium]